MLEQILNPAPEGFRKHNFLSFSLAKLLRQRLYRNCLVHHFGVIVFCHFIQYAVQGIQKLCIAFLYGNTNVDIFVRHFEVAVCAGEIKKLEIRLSYRGSHSGRHISYNGITFSRFQCNQHCRCTFLCRKNVCIFNLRQTGIIPDSILLGCTGHAF